MENEELMVDQQTAVALVQLELEGLIHYDEKGAFTLTDKGVDYAYNLWYSHEPKDRLALFTLVNIMLQIAEQEVNQ